jgi:hypothetical protein
MEKFLKNNCRLILAVAFLIIFFPAFGMALYNFYCEYGMAKENIQGESMFIAQLFSDIKRSDIEQTQKLLNTVVATDLYKLDQENCQKYLTVISDQNKEYTYIGIANSSGDLVCGSLSLPQELNINYRPYFQKMLEERKFIAGDYSIGSLTGKPVMPFVQPIFDASGQIVGAAVAFRDLSWADDIKESGIIFPENAVIMVSDNQGIVTDCFIKSDECIGKKLASTPLGKIMLGKNEKGTAKTIGLDGITKFYSFIPFSNIPGGEKFYITVGVNDSVNLFKIISLIAPNLVLLLGVSILGIIVARRECDSCELNSQANKKEVKDL